jgi:hypothetical protein
LAAFHTPSATIASGCPRCCQPCRLIGLGRRGHCPQLIHSTTTSSTTITTSTTASSTARGSCSPRVHGLRPCQWHAQALSTARHDLRPRPRLRLRVGRHAAAERESVGERRREARRWLWQSVCPYLHPHGPAPPGGGGVGGGATSGTFAVTASGSGTTAFSELEVDECEGEGRLDVGQAIGHELGHVGQAIGPESR